MAAPARKIEEEAGKKKPDIAPSILKLVKKDPASEPGSENVGPTVSRLNKEQGIRQQGPQTQDQYQSQTESSRNPKVEPYRSTTTPPGFKTPPPQRSGVEGASFQAGRGLGEAKKAWRQGEQRKAQPPLQGPPAPPQPAKSLADLDFNRIADAAKSGDPRAALGEALTQVGVGRKIGNTLFIIWGAFLLVAGLIPILGLFSGSSVFLIFNLLLFSPKTVYRITEFILDLVGVGEALQAADKVGLSRVNITLSGWAKAGVIIIDLVFLLWHLIFIAALLFTICQAAGLGSGIPGVGSALNLVAKGADYVTGLPVSSLREVCSSLSGLVGGSPSSGGNFTGTGAGGDRCSVITDSSNYCSPDNLKTACDWNATTASQVCHSESGGNPNSEGQADPCYVNGQKYPVSFGLFQLNVYSGSTQPEFRDVCSGVLKYNGECRVPLKRNQSGQLYCPERICYFGSGGLSAYQTCVAAVKNPQRNIKQACNLYHTSLSWGHWEGYKDCKALGKITN